jgi:pantoate--beta-alanine ligase
LVRTRAELRQARTDLIGTATGTSGSDGRDPIGLVPTMGALHDGHSALLSAARARNAAVIATIFVNPLQFGPNEDLERYPRSFDADLERCRAAGVDLVWAPAVADMYPTGTPQVSVSAGPLAEILEGQPRPGHFAGVLTVVAKLLNTVAPGRAYFGEKDYQQLVLVRRMVADLDIGTEIVGVETVREPDGLALSSRNVYLSAGDRQRALALVGALRAGQSCAAAGAHDVLDAAAKVLHDAGVTPDYLQLRSPDLQADPQQGPARLLVAAPIGRTRLIDNILVNL